MQSINNYTGYKNTVTELTGYLKTLTECDSMLKLEKNNQSLEELINRLETDTFNVAIVGEFNRGKSSLINALLGKKVLPTAIFPTTATVNKITFGLTPYAEIMYKDGTSEKLELEDDTLASLKQYVTKLSDESNEKAATIKEAVIYYPTSYCKNGVSIIDTPGLNDDATMTEVTLSVIPQTDAAIMVLRADSPYSATEQEFVQNNIVANDLGKLLFVVNGIDALQSDEDRQRIVQNIKERILDAASMKLSAVYGEGSEEYAAGLKKMSNVKVIGLSAKQALKAKVDNDEVALQNSGFAAFEKELERFLVEERAFISLVQPVNKIKQTALELTRACAIRSDAIAMEKSDFISKCEKAEKEIIELRNNQVAELQNFSKAADLTYRKLQPEIETFWTEMHKVAEEIIDTYQVTESDLSTQNSASEVVQDIVSKVRKGIDAFTQNKSEYIQTCIDRDLKVEIDNLSSFEEKLVSSLDQIQSNILEDHTVEVKTDDLSTVDNSIIYYLNYSFLGAGGLYQGFKKAGLKGALVGGIGSYVGVWGTAALLGSVLSGGWLLLVCVLMGKASGSWILDKFFHTDTVGILKEKLRKVISDELEKSKSSFDYAAEVRKQVDKMFSAAKENITKESDELIDRTQNQLAQLKVEITSSTIEKDTEMKRIESVARQIADIYEKTEEIDNQINALIESKYGELAC